MAIPDIDDLFCSDQRNISSETKDLVSISWFEGWALRGASTPETTTRPSFSDKVSQRKDRYL